jgi:hypothetical protein
MKQEACLQAALAGAGGLHVRLVTFLLADSALHHDTSLHLAHVQVNIGRGVGLVITSSRRGRDRDYGGLVDGGPGRRPGSCAWAEGDRAGRRQSASSMATGCRLGRSGGEDRGRAVGVASLGTGGRWPSRAGGARHDRGRVDRCSSWAGVAGRRRSVINNRRRVIAGFYAKSNYSMYDS